MKLLIITTLSILFSTSVQATEEKEKDCNINAMNGRWTSYQGAVLGNPHTGICDFKVANGLAQGTCDFSTGFQGPFTGEVVVNKDCSATLDMDFAPVPVISMFQIQLHKDKQSFVGRWKNNHDVIGVTNAVKR
jgi:hypothetical protein